MAPALRPGRKPLLIAAFFSAVLLGGLVPRLLAIQPTDDFRRYLPKFFQELPGPKQAYEVEEAQRRAAAEHAPTPVPKGPPPRTTPAPWPTGISDEKQVPFTARTMFVQNQWHQVIGGVHVQVYAGLSPVDTKQGVVAVMRVDMDGTPIEGPTLYSTPVKGGTVRIEAERGTLLTLRTEEGQALDFDAAGRQFTTARP